MSGGKGSNTTTTTSAPNPAAQREYKDILARANQVASTPYQAYSGELVAPINAQQQLGIANINEAAGFAAPAITGAMGYAQGLAAPISEADIQRYMNPYTQQVVDATMAQFGHQNAMQQQQVLGNAISQGALGNDRVGVTGAELARMQSLAQMPVVAGLYNQGFQQSLAAAQQQKQNLGQAAYALGNLGVQGQQAGLAGAGAQFGVGTYEQQVAQKQLDAMLEQWREAQGFPYAQTGWLAGIGTGVGSQMGGTSTTTTPPPDPWAQLAGAGMMAAGMAIGSDRRIKHDVHEIGQTKDGQPIYRFRYRDDPNGAVHIGLMAQDVERSHPEAVGKVGGVRVVDYDAATRDAMAHGGRIAGFAGGGTPLGVAPTWSVPWIPQIQITPGRGAPTGGGAPAPAQTGIPGLQEAMGIAKAIKGAGSTMGAPGIDTPIMQPADWAGGQMAPVFTTPEGVNVGGGGFGNFLSGLGSNFGWARGGFVPFGEPIIVPRSMQDGGTPRPDDPLSAQNWLGYQIEDADTGQITGGGTFDEPGEAVPLPQPRPPVPGLGSGPVYAATGAENAPVTLAGPTDGVAAINRAAPLPPPRPSLPSSVLALDEAGSPADAGGVGGFAPAPAPAADSVRRNIFGLPAASPELTQALIAAGAGMLASRSPNFGVAVGEGALRGLGAYAGAQKQAREEQRLDVHVKQLEERAKHAQAELAERTRHNTVVEARMDRAIKEGKTPQGYHWVDGKLEAIGGGPADPEQVKKLAEARVKAGATLDDETVKDMAAQYLAGDRTVFQNLGRGAQGAENVIRIRAEVSRQAREAGMTPAQIAVKMAEFSGMMSGQRALGTRTANIEMAANEARNMIPPALQLSEKINRTTWTPVNRAIGAYLQGTNDPDMAAWGAANFSLVNTYVRAIAPTGVPPESAREHALKMLNTALSKDAYRAVLNQMDIEMDAALKSPAQVMEKFRQLYGGGEKPKEERTPIVAPKTTATVPAVDERQRAIDWVKANPNDPRAAEIKKRLGIP